MARLARQRSNNIVVLDGAQVVDEIVGALDAANSDELEEPTNDVDEAQILIENNELNLNVRTEEDNTNELFDDIFTDFFEDGDDDLYSKQSSSINVYARKSVPEEAVVQAKKAMPVKAVSKEKTKVPKKTKAKNPKKRNRKDDEFGSDDDEDEEGGEGEVSEIVQLLKGTEKDLLLKAVQLLNKKDASKKKKKKKLFL